VLSDDELQALHDIERRMRWERAELARLFNSDELQSVKSHRQRAKARVLLAAAAVTGLALLGPRMLNEAEVRKQRRRPLPRTEPTTAPSPGGPILFRVRPRRRARSGSGTYSSPPSTVAPTPPAMAHVRKEGLGCLPDREPERIESLSRDALTFQLITARARQQVPTTTGRAELERK
jgi:hypothetical protein